MEDHSMQGYMARLVEQYEAVIQEACVSLRTRYGITGEDPDMAALTDAFRELMAIIAIITGAK